MKSPFDEFVKEDALISPRNGYRCKRITKQNIRQFGYESVVDLHSEYPDFPTVCPTIRSKYVEACREAVKASAHAREKTSKSAYQRYLARVKQCSAGGCTKLLSREQTRVGGTFCSHSCRALVTNALRSPPSAETRSKTSATALRRAHESYGAKPSLCKSCTTVLPYDQRKRARCLSCSSPSGKIEMGKGRKRYRVPAGPSRKACASCNTWMCSLKMKYCGSCSTNIRHYRTLCVFKFNVYDYPLEFDLKLIEDRGWYSPNGYKSRNQKPNIDGVSRDHLYSVADGFKQMRDPSCLSHPANCSIMIHNGAGGNNSKNMASSVTWDELLTRIAKWDERYGAMDGDRTHD